MDVVIYKDGRVIFKGNFFKIIKEIFCLRCNFLKLLYLIDGKGVKKLDFGVIYCKRYLYIEKLGFDIYG